MKLFLAVFGKAGSPFVSEEVSRYVKRLRGTSYPLEIVELKESRRDDKLKALSEEAEIFEKRFPKKEFIRVILSEEGKLMATIPLARWVEQKNSASIVFLIGSAYGIDENLKASANLLLSLSPLTFTHDHARVIATEQIYRIAMVITGHPYHHV